MLWTCYGMVKGMGLAWEEVQAEIMRMCLNPLELIYAVNCWGLVKRDRVCRGRGSELNSR